MKEEVVELEAAIARGRGGTVTEEATLDELEAIWEQVNQEATTGFYRGRVYTFHRLERMETESRP